MPGKKDEDAAAAAELFVDNGGRKLKECSRKDGLGRMQRYANNSEFVQLDIDEVEECSLGLEYADVDVKQILRKATREGKKQIEVFKVKEGEQPVASKWRWDDWQRQRKSQEEKSLE